MLISLIHQAVDHSASQFPEQEAIRYSDKSLNYRELADKSNSLATLLQTIGVQRRDRVGIYMNKGLESIIAMYAIMKAGACYVPIDPGSSAERVAYILEDCAIKVLFSQPQRSQVIEKLTNERSLLQYCLGIEALKNTQLTTINWAEIEQLAAATLPDTGVIEQDLAYIIYTSGSTGEPKGIMHTHYSGLAYAKWVCHYYGFKRSDRFSNHAPLHFDMSTLDFFAAQLVAATTVIIPEAVTRLPASYSQLLQQECISVFFTVPLALVQLLLQGVLEKRDLSKLRWIIFGGESTPTKHLRALMKSLPDTRFNHMYGPAESNGCTCYPVPMLDDNDDSPIPIGKAFATMETKVLDEDAQELSSTGDIGELIVRGPSLMSGYWGRTDLTKKVFYFATVIPGIKDKYYRTGDMVQINAQGDYIFLGRQDRQIKVRGYRVELDGVENHLLSHPHVQEAAVFSQTDAEGNQSISAVVILMTKNQVSTDTLVDFLLQKIPRYAIPQTLKIQTVLPRISSGKINYLQLMEDV